MMKKLTKLLLVAAILALCIGLMTVTALAADLALLDGTIPELPTALQGKASISYAGDTYTITVNNLISEALVINTDANLEINGAFSYNSPMFTQALTIDANGDVAVTNANGFINFGGATNITGRNITLTGASSTNPLFMDALTLTASGDVSITDSSYSIVTGGATNITGKNVSINSNYDGPMFFQALNINATGDVSVKNDSGFIVFNSTTNITGRNITLTGDSGTSKPLFSGALTLTASAKAEITNENGFLVTNGSTSITANEVIITSNINIDKAPLFPNTLDIESDGTVKLINKGIGNVVGDSLSVKTNGKTLDYGASPKVNITIQASDAKITVSENPDGSAGETWNGKTDPSAYRYLEINASDSSSGSLPMGFMPFMVENPFIDVSFNDWFFEPVNFVYANELMVGTSKWKFDPNTAITRGMLTTILARLNGVDTNAGKTWYEAGMNWALGKGLTDKTDALSPIPREEIAVMLYRNAGSPAVSGDLSRFSDANSISAYAKDAMLWAVQQGIFAGMGNGILAPQGNATRAQVATILQRLLVK